jgi:hypothetical protein
VPVADPGPPVPSPAALSSAALDLRGCARQLRASIAAYEGLLAPVDRYDTPATWQGPCAERAGEALRGWRKGVETGRGLLLRRAAQWEQLAGQLERQAAQQRLTAAPAAG